MPKRFEDFTSEQLAIAIELSGVQCCLAWTEWPGIELARDARAIRTESDVPFPFFNNVFCARLDAADIDRAIEEVLTPFRERGTPMFWWTGPTTRPVDLGKHLEQQGLQHAFEAAAMAVDLHAMREDFAMDGPITVEEVADEVALGLWCEVMTPVYEFPDFAAQAWTAMLMHLGVGPHKTLRHFLGMFDGKPVATASLFLDAQVASISSVATLPEFRGRGIATAVTLEALRTARNANYHVGTLFSSSMAESMYRQIGFEKYSTGTCYAWEPKGE